MAAATPLFVDAPLPGRDPETLRQATARLRALGIDDEVVFSSDRADEVLAYLAEIPPCAATS
jgi:hypothetical protein